jgi:hypothetical protein
MYSLQDEVLVFFFFFGWGRTKPDMLKATKEKSTKNRKSQTIAAISNVNLDIKNC